MRQVFVDHLWPGSCVHEYLDLLHRLEIHDSFLFLARISDIAFLFNNAFVIVISNLHCCEVGSFFRKSESVLDCVTLGALLVAAPRKHLGAGRLGVSRVALGLDWAAGMVWRLSSGVAVF